MHIDVDMGLCQNLAQCVFAAPEVFDLDDAGDLVYQASAPASQRAEVEAAVMACPVQAITLQS
ncbi:ferredoxin [Nocardia grenadensis]|uniref:ferredoxin n=1 Tax=Nocardia grenadensis TaxID=931537 RepID=UPI003D726BD5